MKQEEMSGRVTRTEYGIPIRNIWHMLIYAWENVPLLNQLNIGEVEDAPTFDALFATLLRGMLQQRMRIGLGRGYVVASDRLRAVRGRVDFAASLKQQTFDHGEAVCDFQHYSVNEPRNQIIRSVLARLIQVGEFGTDQKAAESLRHGLRWLVRNLHGVDMIDLSPELIRRRALEQNDNDYRLMLSVCEWFLLRKMPLDGDPLHAVPQADRDALVLHRIYERFVANFYRVHLQDWIVTPQKRLDWHADLSNEHLPSMIPDLLLQHRQTGKTVLLDTKFTAASLVDHQWGKALYDSSHLYQLYAYLRSQEQVSDAYRHAEGVLLYPVVRAQISERVQLQGHLIRIEIVDLAAPWQDVERQLSSLMGQGLS